MSNFCLPEKICFIKQRPARLPRNAVILAPQACAPQACAPVACAPQTLPPCTELITQRYADFGANAVTTNLTTDFSTAVLSLIINGPTNANPLLTTNSNGGINIPFTGRYKVEYSANVVQAPVVIDGKSTPVTTSPATPIAAFLSNGSGTAFANTIEPLNFGSQLDSTGALMGSVSTSAIVDFTGVSPSAPGVLYLMFDAPVVPATIPFGTGTVPFPIKLTIQGPLHSTVPPVTSVVCQPTVTTVGFSCC